MESIYISDGLHPNITDVVNLSEYFSKFAFSVSPQYARISKNTKFAPPSPMEYLGVDQQIYQDLEEKFSVENFSWKSKKLRDKLILPTTGFLADFTLYTPPADCNLKSCESLRAQRFMDDARRNKFLKYTGEISCTNHVTSVAEDKNKEKLQEYLDYVLTVRVYIPTDHRAYLVAKGSSKPLKVSQEFIVSSQQTLDVLRDRIMCPEDFNSAEGDVSENPFKPTSLTNKDLYKSAMFFINDIFFIDSRISTNVDYSEVVINWAKSKNLNLHSKRSMEDSKFSSFPFRFGYPYLYTHQGNCEHLVVFTDARLVTPRDMLIKSAYPIMTSYATLRAKICPFCTKRPAKFIVVGMEKLPLLMSYFCGICLYQYCYNRDKKICNFKVYKYLDRVAVL